MRWYELVKIVHYLGLIAMFGAFVIHPRAGLRLRAAGTAPEARTWMGFLDLTRGMFHGGAAMMLLSGLTMAAMRWRGQVPFVAVSLVTLSIVWVVWTLVPGRHLRAMRWTIDGAGPGPLAAEVTRVICAPGPWIVALAINVAMLGVLFEMTLKLGLAGGIALVLAGAACRRMTLEGRVALVTGGSRGIGAAIARLFAREGASVAVHGRDAAALCAVQMEIAREGGRAIEMAADLTRYDEIEAMRQGVEAAFGPVDILVANAGANLTPPRQALEETTEEGWRASIDANLTATFLTIRSFLPGMKARCRGCITTMSSAAARRPTTMSPIPYAVAKAGIQLLTQAVAMQAGPFGVRVNCIAPETILTERNADQIPAAVQAALAEDHPLQRLGTPDDVAHAALYLASEDSSWLTGVILDVAGGAVLR